MKQRITAVRGTTIPISIGLIDDTGAAYTLQSGEKLIFGIKSSIDSSSCLISKILTEADLSDDVYVTSITPSETASFRIGKYYYDVSLQSSDDFYNVIECSEFCLLPNITSLAEVQA